jgi:predicted nuclease of restriction endonuclease-like (RecB) superfamily
MKHELEHRDISSAAESSADLINDLRQIINQSRHSVAQAVNASLSLLYWQLGKRLHREVLAGERGEYGKQIVVAVARQLTTEYGNSFNQKQLWRMIQFAEIYPDEQIVVSLIRQLSWTHFVALIPLKDPLKRDFYAEMCRIERWSVRTLRKKIDSMLYERTALSKKPEELGRAELEQLRAEDRLTPDMILKDPYILDFLDLQDRYLEKDFEDAIIREMEQFLLELGAGFSFIARQYRIQIDDDDFYIDMLFYNRRLRRLFAIELKLGDFKARYKGQMELYLRWLDKHERQEHEESPLGLILCSGKKKEQIQLLELGRSGIHVAEYMTVLPSKDILEKEFQKAIEQARVRQAKSLEGVDKEL